MTWDCGVLSPGHGLQTGNCQFIHTAIIIGLLYCECIAAACRLSSIQDHPKQALLIAINRNFPHLLLGYI